MKREDVKGIVPGISEEQLQQLMDAAGADIEGHKQTIATLTAQRDGYKDQLAAANAKLEGYDPEWKAKAAQAQTEADARVAQIEASHAAEQAVAGLRFSSESAKKAFLADLAAKKLPVQEGKLLGFDGFAKAYKAADPGAFAPDAPAPKITAAAPGVPAQPTTRDAANAAFRAFFGKE